MHARVTTLEGAPDKMDDATRHLQEQVLPQLRQMEGFEGFIAFGDRQSGKLVGVAFWESEEVLRATEEEVSGVRSEAAMPPAKRWQAWSSTKSSSSRRPRPDRWAG